MIYLALFALLILILGVLAYTRKTADNKTTKKEVNEVKQETKPEEKKEEKNVEKKEEKNVESKNNIIIKQHIEYLNNE